jgi:hypothetical protein
VLEALVNELYRHGAFADPYVGVTPTTPQKDAGWRMDPPVSLPSATTAVPCATAAADPPLDPPGTRSL